MIPLNKFRPISRLETPNNQLLRSKFPVIDAHNHLARTRDAAALVAKMDLFNIRLIVNLDGFWDARMEEQFLLFSDPYPNRFAIFCRVDLTDIDLPDFTVKTRKYLKSCVRRGVVGIKFSKSLGVKLTDRQGHYLKPDDDRLRVVWETAAEFNLPVTIHVADPPSFFDRTIDETHERYEELIEHPDWSYGSRPCPRFDELLDAQENLLSKNPETCFIVAHVGSHAENLRNVARMLDLYPNMMVDTAERISELGRQPYTARDFLIRYQDRVLYGTDLLPTESNISANYRFFETRDEYFPYNSLDEHNIVIRMYWEEEDSPSVEVPIGDFFGVGHGVASHYISLPLNMITRQGAPQSFAAMNSFFHMPFARRGRITIGNDTGMVIPNFYYYIDYRSLDSFFEDGLHFHAMWHRENPTDGVLHMEQLGQTQKTFRGPIEKVSSMKNLNGQGNYVILDAIGAGHYIGCNLSIDHINPVPNVTWFGEGDDMIFIDGESWPPSMHGTGTEDYFCTAWDFPSGKFSGPYHGISLAEPYRTPDVWETPGTWGAGSFGYSGKWTAYRFHIEDPIIFNRSILVTIEHGHANSLSNDYASTAYWYQTEPHKQFRPLPVAAARMPLTTKESLKSYCRSI